MHGLTETRAFHTPKFGKTWGGKVIPKIGREMAGLTQITSAFPLWDGDEKKFGPKFREVLLQVKTAHLSFLVLQQSYFPLRIASSSQC